VCELNQEAEWRGPAPASTSERGHGPEHEEWSEAS